MVEGLRPCARSCGGADQGIANRRLDASARAVPAARDGRPPRLDVRSADVQQRVGADSVSSGLGNSGRKPGATRIHKAARESLAEFRRSRDTPTGPLCEFLRPAALGSDHPGVDPNVTSEIKSLGKMLTPKDFIVRWGKDEAAPLRFAKETVQGLRLSEDDKAFLIQAGLPEDAAPFLTFEAPKSEDLPTVAEQWKLTNEFERFRVIGFDGSGSPIALDEEANGEVVRLDHDNSFARVLMNKSVRHLAASLLAYRKMITDSQAEFGEDAFLDGKTSPAVRQGLRQALISIDPAAMKHGCFWHDELQILDANAG